MNKPLVYVAAFFGAVLAAVVLQVLVQDEFGISQESIVVGSLATAGILSLSCAGGALVITLVRARK
jgi:hypothetical protein